MQNWKHQIELGDLHNKHEKGELTIQEVGKQLGNRLEKLRLKYYPEDWHLEEYVWWLHDDVNDVNDYDNILAEIYDWADDNRVWLNPVVNN